MTNIEVGLSSCLDGDSTRDCNPRMAALLAVHLVSQVLDEAYVIANAARDSGQPWRYLSMLKSFKTSREDTTDDENLSFEASNGDCDQNENKTEIVANIVATSTPQKQISIIAGLGEGDKSISHIDTTFIGQGDEDLEMQQNELATSMFINHLFDMSDVEHVVIGDDTESMQNTSEPNYMIGEAMNKMMGSCVAHNFIPREKFNLVPNVTMNDGQMTDLSRSEHSDYSYLADAFVADISGDVAFYIDDDMPCVKNDNTGRYQSAVVKEIREHVDTNAQEMIQKNVSLYEDAYVTLNRDYDQGSEEDGFPILQDPKGMIMQEVELMTANSSDDNLSYPEFQHKPVRNTNPKIREKTFMETTISMSGASGSRKSTLARRCRLQGARLLSCFRGWWRRKSPDQDKEFRSRGPVQGICPLSPDARRRASSLLDNRIHRSPSPSRPVAWKFNTVNETVVNSNRWREYTFDVKPEECGEY